MELPEGYLKGFKKRIKTFDDLVNILKVKERTPNAGGNMEGFKAYGKPPIRMFKRSAPEAELRQPPLCLVFQLSKDACQLNTKGVKQIPHGQIKQVLSDWQEGK